MLLAPGSECPKKCFLSAFWQFGAEIATKHSEKHSLGHSEPGAQKHSKSTPWDTFRPGPFPVNGGRDRSASDLARVSPESLSRTAPIALSHRAICVCSNRCWNRNDEMLYNKSEHWAFLRRFALSQIASDLRFAMRTTNRNRSKIARFGAFRLCLCECQTHLWKGVKKTRKRRFSTFGFGFSSLNGKRQLVSKVTWGGKVCRFPR